MASQLTVLGKRSRRSLSASWSFIAIGLAVLLLLPTPSSVQASRPPAAKAGAGDQSATARGDQSSSRPALVERTRGEFAVERPLGPALIHLGAGYEFDPAAGNVESSLPAALRSNAPTGNQVGRYLVQFRGPITNAERALIETHGGSIVSYIPDYAFLISMPADARARLASDGRVAWVGVYHAAFKLSQQPEMTEPGRRDMVLLLFPTGSMDATVQALENLGGVVKDRSDNGINKMVRVELDTANLSPVAQLSDVAWIEPHHIPQLDNNLCQWVVQTNVSESRRVWDMGITGTGQVISSSDSGIRTAHNQFRDAALTITTFGHYPAHRKVIAYLKTIETPNIAFGDDGLNSYHGTHTNGTCGGNDAPNAADARDGMAKDAKIFFMDGGGTAGGAGIFTPLDLNELFIVPYTGNGGGAARIITNSWGSPVGGAYDLHSMTADQFTWDHPDFLAFFSAGNNGPAVNTTGSPATAKNIVTAGGTGNGASSGNIYNFTSRGPTDDGRLKPTICAPANLSSALGSGNAGYTTLEGTSMSSPAMAGATVLIRQYYTDGFFPTGVAVPANSIASPSAALLKATAINSADTNVGAFTVPDNNIGWGRINVDNALYFPGDLLSEARSLAIVDNTEGLLTGEFVEYQVYVASSAIPLKATVVWSDYPGTPAAAIELVNNINFSATDGVNTYRGNVYLAGQSNTGGSFDGRNVEENVRRNTPTVGLWTFRIEGANVPIGPQPFALVVTGDLAADGAIVSLDKATYSGTDVLGIRVVDTNAGASVSVSITSDTEPTTETVVIPGSNGLYLGTLPLSLDTPVSQNGELSVSDGDQILLEYDDASPVVTLTTNALVNISGPAISDVRATNITESSATIAWNSTSPSNSKVYYGTTPALGSETGIVAALVTSHTSPVGDLLPNTTYYYDVESYDNQANGVRDTNGGLHYTFSTDNNRDILLVIGDNTFDKVARYDNAFASTGWTYTKWEGALAADPEVGDLVTGMASYKAVVWQTGLEQYPQVPDAARDSISALMDLGSRFTMWSHDVAWDFCDAASPDFSAARCTWMEAELHADWQVDPLTWTQVRGIAADPISGAYVAGIPYTPHRDGAAGDEVDGLAAGGAFSYVWRNNEASIDDIGLRFTASAPVGSPTESVWGGTANKVVSNFYEWAHLNTGSESDATRADVLDKTLIWLIGHDHPSTAILAPNGGENFVGASVSISWTESVDGGFAVGSRKLYYSGNSGDQWVLITASPGTSPYSWDISAIPNGAQYRVRMVLADNATPALLASDASNANFTINRPGGDNRGPAVLAGSIATDPNPILVPNAATLSATVSDVYTGNSNVAAAEWSEGVAPAPAGTGTAMTGTFTSPLVNVSAILDSNTLDTPTTTLWVRGRDAVGNWGNANSLTVNVNTTTSVDSDVVPGRFALYANSPNPFNPTTLIRFDLPKATQVRLDLYNVAGRKIRTLASGSMTAGSRSVLWDGRDTAGKAVGSGVYFYRLEAGDFTAMRKMTLLK